MDEAANVVGGGAFLDFPIPSAWLDDLLDDDGDDDAPYSGGGVDSLLEAIDLSAATDKDVIGFVRANYERCKERNLCPPAPIDDAGRLTRPDPWELGRLWFITSKKFGSDEKTRRGFWKEKDNEFTAIRGDQWQQPAQRRPVYIGFKRTLEFYMNDGTKTEWLMNEFAMIHQSDDGHFFLKEEVVISEVFKKDRDANLRPPMHPQDRPREMANGNDQGDREDEPNMDNLASHGDDHPPRHGGGAQGDLQAPMGKRMRPDDDTMASSIRISESEVWQQLTRIYVEVPKEVGSSKRKDSKRLVYAVCHHCDRVFRASSKNGTSSLRRHAEGCQFRHSSQERARGIVPQPGPSGGYAG